MIVIATTPKTLRLLRAVIRLGVGLFWSALGGVAVWLYMVAFVIPAIVAESEMREARVAAQIMRRNAQCVKKVRMTENCVDW